LRSHQAGPDGAYGFERFLLAAFSFNLAERLLRADKPGSFLFVLLPEIAPLDKHIHTATAFCGWVKFAFNFIKMVVRCPS
jgi:hypothetical protein